MAIEADKHKELIRRIKQGARPAFDELIEHYKTRGFAIAFSMTGNTEDARDVLQEACIKAYLGIRGFQERSQFYTWFLRITINCSLDFLRKKKRANRVFVELFSDEDESVKEPQAIDKNSGPAKMLIDNEINCALEDCITQLPEKQKTCFILKHQNGLKIKEIAQALKCNPATVKVHIFRAVRNLRKSLLRYKA